MAESQVPYSYEPDRLKAIRASISEPRFATYMKRSGNHAEYACALYLYNARLAKAFLFPLNILEVTLRNAIDEMLVQRFGPEWHADQTFRNTILTPNSCAALDKAMSRAGANAPRNQVVATLTFDFWSNLFRSDYGPLWRTTINVVFPRLPRGQSRRDVQRLVKSINEFRNRVAHHEPIFDANVNEIYTQIVRVVDLRCPETARWMRHFSTIGMMIRTRPRLGEAMNPPLATRIDPEFLAVRPATPVSEVFERIDERHPVIVLVDDRGGCAAAMTLHDVTRAVVERARATRGLVDLSELTLRDVLAEVDPAGGWIALPAAGAASEMVAAFARKGTRVVVALDGDGRVVGALARAHRRY